MGGNFSPIKYLLYSTESSWIKFIRRLPKRAGRDVKLLVHQFSSKLKTKRNSKTFRGTLCEIFVKSPACNLNGQACFGASSRGRKAGSKKTDLQICLVCVWPRRGVAGKSCYLNNSPSLCKDSCSPNKRSSQIVSIIEPQVSQDSISALCLPPCRRSASISMSSNLNITRTPAKAKSRWSFQNLLLLCALQWQREGVVQFWHYFMKRERQGKVFFSSSQVKQTKSCSSTLVKDQNSFNALYSQSKPQRGILTAEARDQYGNSLLLWL